MANLQRVAVLLNASAGTLNGQDRGIFRDNLISLFADHGISAELEYLPGDKLQSGAEHAAARAERGEIDAVVAGGGDGSIRTVASVLSGTRIALGVLPLGTLNHFAKDLGLPLSLEDAVGTIASAHVRAVDVGAVNGNVFINNSSIGVYPSLVVKRDRKRRMNGDPKWKAAVSAGVQMLRRFPVHRLSILANGEKEPVRTLCLFVGNNEYDLTLPGFGSRKRLDGGKLWLYVTQQRSRLALVWLAMRSWFGLLKQARDFTAVPISSAEISSKKRRLLVATDGEVMVMHSPLRYESRPAALRVIAPQPAES
jgi:diacylglycerol kinase family enzyme